MEVSELETNCFYFHSVAIVSYEVVTRRSAFSGVQPTLVIALIIESGLKPDEKQIVEVGKSLEEHEDKQEIFKVFENVITQCWDHNPAHRPTATASK